MNYNLHTHTSRSDASGEDEKYISRAIENGFTTLGFSDHAPLRFEDGFESAFRVPFVKAREYVYDIKKLKERYKRNVDILVGFEMEYYPEYFNKTVSQMVEWGVEYLILGQHYVYPEYPKKTEYQHVVRGSASEKLLSEYADRVVEAMETMRFTYVAHPDMFLFLGNKEYYKNQMRKICVASKKLNVPLEINLLGIRANRTYPNKLFWELAGEEGAPVTFGADAHQPVDVYNKDSINIAHSIVDEYGLNYVGKAEVKLLR